MILISHRGNVHGPNSSLENTEGYIEKAKKKYFVEIDVEGQNKAIFKIILE